MHNSLFFGLGSTIIYKDKFSLNFKLYLEQRAWSYGVNNIYLNTTFPYFNFMAKDSALIFKKKFKYNFKMGDLYDVDEANYGLRAYNIDIQGISAKADMKNLSASFIYAADMGIGIGLNTDEYFRFIFERKLNNKKKYSSIGITTDYLWIITDITNTTWKEEEIVLL